MRQKHEGTIETLANGSFRAVVTIQGKKVVGPRVPKRRDALPALRAKVNARSLTQHPTLSSLILARIRQRLESGKIQPTTAELHENLFRKHIEQSNLGALRLDQIEQRDLDLFASALPGGPHTTRNVCSLICATLKEHGVSLTYACKKPASTKSVSLTPTQQKQLLRASVGEEKWLIGLLMQAGLRRGEALGLKHEDADEDGALLQRQVVSVRGALMAKQLKTRKSESWIPLPRWMLRCGYGKGQGWVFPDPDDSTRPRDPAWAYRKVIEIGQRIGIKNLTPHDLRHSCAMTLLERGVDVVTAAEMLRHDPALLMKVYAQSRRDLKREARSRIAL